MGENWVYVLSCENDVIYVGETERLFKRLEDHCSGKGSKITQKNKPLKLLALYKVSDNFEDEEFVNVDTKKMNTSLEYNIFRLFEAHHGNFTYGASHCKMIDNITYKRNLYNYQSNRPYCSCKMPCEYKKDTSMWVCSRSRHGWVSSGKYGNSNRELPDNFIWKSGDGCDFEQEVFLEEKQWFEKYLCCK